MDNVIDVLVADRDPNHVFRHARVDSFLFGELLVGGGPGMDGEGFSIADTVGESVSMLCGGQVRGTWPDWKPF